MKMAQINYTIKHANNGSKLKQRQDQRDGIQERGKIN